MKKKLNLSIYSDCFLLAIIPHIVGKNNSGEKLTSIDGLAAHLYYVAFHNREIGIRTETPEPHQLLIYEKDELVLAIEEREIIGTLDETIKEEDVPTFFTQLIHEI